MAIRPGFAKTGGDDDNAFHAVRNTIIDGLRDVLKRGGNNGQVNLRWHIAESGECGTTKHFGNRGVDKIDIAGKTSGNKLFSCDMTPFMGSAGDA